MIKLCTRCKKEKPVSEFRVSKKKNYQQKEIERSAVWCRVCENEAASKYYYSHKEQCLRANKEWAKRNVEKTLEFGRRRNRKYRMELLQAYGGKDPKCACCGESELKFLCLDHINGGGGKHRKELRARGNN